MNTQPALSSIEHLDFTPTCEARRGTCGAPATHLVTVARPCGHGADRFGCPTHVDLCIQFDGSLVHCPDCRAPYIWSVELLTIRPLGSDL